jgi:hypothetical protein
LIGSWLSSLGCLLRMSSSSTPNAASGTVLMTAARFPATGAGVTSAQPSFCKRLLRSMLRSGDSVLACQGTCKLLFQPESGILSKAGHVLQENMLFSQYKSGFFAACMAI